MLRFCLCSVLFWFKFYLDSSGSKFIGSFLFELKFVFVFIFFDKFVLCRLREIFVDRYLKCWNSVVYIII